MFRKNVAGQYLYFALVKAADGTALTGATVTGKRAIDGAAQGSVTGTISEEAGGQYKIALSQADTNGNNIGYLFTATGAIPVSISVLTTAADPTDATAFGLSRIDAAISTRSTYAGADTAGTTTLLGRVPGTVQPQTGDAYARLGAAGAGLTALGDARLANLDGAISGIAAAVWGAGTRTLTSFGTLVADIATSVWGAATRVLTGFGFTVTASNALTAQQTADAVWNEATAGHQTAGTTGKALTDAGAVGDPWTTQLPGAYGVGTAGRILGGTAISYAPAPGPGQGDGSLLGR